LQLASYASTAHATRVRQQKGAETKIGILIFLSCVRVVLVTVYYPVFPCYPVDAYPAFLWIQQFFLALA
jgi:hypothetical protein